jgi:hypothetical protein
MKDAELAPPLAFKLEVIDIKQKSDGSSVTSLVLVPTTDSSTKRKQPTKQQHQALLAFKASAATKGRLDKDGNFAGLHLDDWRIEFYRRSSGDTEAAKRQQFHRVSQLLLDDGFITVTDDVYRLAGEHALFEEGLLAKKLVEKKQAGDEINNEASIKQTSGRKPRRKRKRRNQ